MVHGHFQSTGAYDAAQGLSDVFNFCLQNDAVRDFDTRWNQIFLRKDWSASGIRPRRFVQKLVARFRTASNSICNVPPRIESRSRDTELSKTEEKGHAISKPGMRDLRREYWSKVRKGEVSARKEKIGECFRWKANGQCSKGDSVFFF